MNYNLARKLPWAKRKGTVPLSSTVPSENNCFLIIFIVIIILIKKDFRNRCKVAYCWIVFARLLVELGFNTLYCLTTIEPFSTSLCLKVVVTKSFPSAELAPPRIYRLILLGFLPFLKGALQYPRKL